MSVLSKKESGFSKTNQKICEFLDRFNFLIEILKNLMKFQIWYFEKGLVFLDLVERVPMNIEP